MPRRRAVNGWVRLKLYKGNVIVVGRDSDADSLFDPEIATFEDDKGAYDQVDAAGFIRLNALRMRIAANLKKKKIRVAQQQHAHRLWASELSLSGLMPTIISPCSSRRSGRQSAWRKRRVLVWGALLSMLPDIDVVWFSFGMHYHDMLGHRGFTHSLLFALFAAIAVTAVAMRTVPRYTPGWFGISRFSVRVCSFAWPFSTP
jgi:hypothetical protein